MFVWWVWDVNAIVWVHYVIIFNYKSGFGSAQLSTLYGILCAVLSTFHMTSTELQKWELGPLEQNNKGSFCSLWQQITHVDCTHTISQYFLINWWWSWYVYITVTMESWSVITSWWPLVMSQYMGQILQNVPCVHRVVHGHYVEHPTSRNSLHADTRVDETHKILSHVHFCNLYFD